MISQLIGMLPAIGLIVGLTMACAPDPESAPMTYFFNGHINSMDGQGRRYTSMLVQNGQIVALGGEEIVSELDHGDYESFDLEGRFVYPGLIEGHGHFLSLGEVVCGLDVSGLDSWDAVLDQTVAYAKETVDTGWIVGKGWHPNHWSTQPANTIEGYPDHRELTRLFPDQPVILHHSSHHALMANQKAMEIAGITRDTPDPDGGRIIRFEDGAPSGILEENAMGLVLRHYQSWKNNRPEQEKAAELKQHLDSAARHCLSYGITTFVDAGISPEEFRIFQEYHEEETLDLRIWAMASGPRLLDGEFDQIVPYRSVDNRLFVQATKAFIDGALGSNGAWMVNEYTDQTGWLGQNVTELSTLEAIGQKCIDLGLQYCVHAIGDRGNREVLDLYQKLFEQNDRDGQSLRWRIEHAQILQPADIGRFSQLGVIPSIQAIHCTSDAPMVIPKIGAELARHGGYPWRSLIDSGSIIANGTDAPVERVNPFENLYASVTRQAAPGKPAFFPEQVMSRTEALQSLTIWNAYACKLEDYMGSLEVGKWADFVILDTDLMTCSSDEILKTQVWKTYVDGRLAWSQDK